MTPTQRRFTLTVHVISSIGWLGATTSFLVLAAISFAGHDDQFVRSFFVVAVPLIDFVIVPFAVIALLSGVVQALGTAWGLLRYRWVVLKLLLTLVAVGILTLDYSRSLGYVTAIVAHPTLSAADLHELKNPNHLTHAGGGLLTLIVTTTLAVFKPGGPTRSARRR